MVIYKRGDAYNVNSDVENNFKYASLSLGNMGFETNKCSFASLMMDEILLECPFGKIDSILGLDPKS